MGVGHITRNTVDGIVVRGCAGPLCVVSDHGVAIRGVVVHKSSKRRKVGLCRRTYSGLMGSIIFCGRCTSVVNNRKGTCKGIFSGMTCYGPCFEPISFSFRNFSRNPVDPPSRGLFVGYCNFENVGNTKTSCGLPTYNGSGM